MLKGKNAYGSYTQSAVSVESPAKLVEMLYEGILRFSVAAKQGIDEEDIEKRSTTSIALLIFLLN